MSDLSMLINGLQVTAEKGACFERRNPLDGTVATRAPAASPADAVMADQWTHKYTRQQAAFPRDWVRPGKFWPSVARVDGAYGDRNLVCTCAPIESYGA